MADRVFTTDDILDGDSPILNAVLERRVAQCFIEFLEQEGQEKPHVVFKVNLDYRVVDVNQRRIKACRISMEYTGNPGSFQIRLLEFTGSSNSSATTFQFPVHQQITVRDWFDIFRGTHPRCPPGHMSDLTDFTFVVANHLTRSLDGCRDFISQCMVRLCAMGVVGWYFVGQMVDGIRFVNFGHYVPTSNFHHIIGNNYEILDEEDEDENHFCRITFIPLHRGEFGDTRFRRIETYRGYRLPYRPL